MIYLLLFMIILNAPRLIGMEEPNQAIVPHTTLPNGYIQNNLPRKISKEICFHVLATKPVLKSEDNRYIGDCIDLVALEIDPQSLGRLGQTCNRMRFCVQQLKQDDTFAQRIIARHNNLFANQWCLENFHQLFRQEETSFSKTNNLHWFYFEAANLYLKSQEMSVKKFKKKLLNNKSFLELSYKTVSKIETATDVNTLHGILKEANPHVAELIKKPTAELQKELLNINFEEQETILDLLDQPTLLSLLKNLNRSINPSYRSCQASRLQRFLNSKKDKSHIAANYQQLIKLNLINEYYIVHSHLGDNYQPDDAVHKKFAQEPQIAFDFIYNDSKLLLKEAIEEDSVEKIKNLISLGVNPNIPLEDLTQMGKFFQSPLHIASKMGKKNAAIELLAQKANPNAKDSYGQTPLHNAVIISRSVDIAKLLLDNKGDPNAKNNFDKTVLYCVYKYKKQEIINLFNTYRLQQDHC